MTPGIPEWPYAQCPVPLVDRDHSLLARPSEQMMDSGRVRRRRKQAEIQEFLKVRWSLTEDQFDAFVDFFEIFLVNGQSSFLMKTYEPSPSSEFRLAEIQWELAFVGAQGGYSYARGDNNYQVTANLEVLDKIIVETNPLPAIVFGYFHDEEFNDTNLMVESNPSACRENVSVLLDGLETGALYVLEIAPTIDGPWDHFIFFALLTTEERATKHKRISMSNHFDGVRPWLRVKLYQQSGLLIDTVMTQAGQPLDSEVQPPDLTIANMDEIESYVQVAAAATDTFGEGVQPLDFYRTTNGFIIPYSFLEDPMIFTSRMYRPFIRKYIIRQHTWGTWGGLNLAGSQDTPVTITGPVGATLKWTRDGTVPSLSTPAPIAYGGVTNNAFVIEDQFGGVIMARCFSGTCPSPLVMVACDKLMFERPNLQITGPANGVSGYCDLPQVDIVTGMTIESGNSCNLLYGGLCSHESLIYGLGTSGGSLATSRDSPSANHGALLRERIKRISERQYIGWPIHATSAEYFEFLTSVWDAPDLPLGSGYFNHWQDAPRNHNWAILCRNADLTDVAAPGPTGFLGVILVAFDASLGGALGTQSETDRSAWATTRDASITDILKHIDLPAVACDAGVTYWLFADRFDIMRSPLYYDEPRDLHWLGPQAIDLAVEITSLPFDPTLADPPVNPYDKFETYYEGDAEQGGLSYRTGTDWDAAWVIKDGVSGTYGWDYFETYAVGAIPDHSTHEPGDGYDYFSDGENWEAGDTNEWVFRVGDLTRDYQDDFESYAAGATPFTMTGGTGWTTLDVYGWRTDSDLIGGSEDFESYAAGAFTGSNTGTNFLISENWITT